MIRVDNLWKKFGRHDALRGLSFSVPEGSAFALIGANGAGKTTTIKVLMNIIEPSRGTATMLGVAAGFIIYVGVPVIFLDRFLLVKFARQQRDKAGELFLPQSEHSHI